MKQGVEEQFRALMQKIDMLNNISQTLSWDMRVMMPRDAAEYRGAEMGFLAGRIHALETSPEMEALLQELEAEPPEDRVLRIMVQKARRTFDKLSKVPEDLYAAYADHNLKTEHVWAEARAKNDFAMVLPYLKQEFKYKKDLISCTGFAGDPVTGLMDEWEAGTTRKQIDRLFEELKAFLVPFVQRLSALPQPDPAPLRGCFPVEKQKAFCREVLQAVGFNFDRGRVDEGAHPYTTFNFRKDIRFTCRYFEDDFTRATLSSLHEGGHAIHWQNMGRELDGTTLAVSTSLPVDESQARFQENILGRSLAFWEHFLPVAEKYFAELKGVSPERFYRALNALHISPLRLTSDELTYNLQSWRRRSWTGACLSRNCRRPGTRSQRPIWESARRMTPKASCRICTGSAGISVTSRVMCWATAMTGISSMPCRKKSRICSIRSERETFPES